MKIATVCSGIGSPEVALKNLGINHTITFACEIDKYARETYLANHEPETMYQDMTAESWDGEKYYSDLMIGGIPCQSFSLAGKRLGELDPRGLLFFDFLRYIKNQQPKYFIIENVKGLLSDNDGKTFQNWIDLLGQSVNGNPFFFPHEDSLMYNLHWQVLNTKDYGLPQNRERVFLVGIRNDLPNSFVFPKGFPLKLRLKDILEDEVDEKYYLSDKMLELLTYEKKGSTEIANINKGGQKGSVISEDSTHVGCLSATDYKLPKLIQVQSATKSGYEIATEGDSINLEHPNSETRRGRVGKQVAQTLTTSCNQGVMIGAMRGRNPENPNDRSKGGNYQQTLEINENGTSNCLSTVQKDNLVIQMNPSLESGGKQPYQQNRVYDSNGMSPALMAGKSDLNIQVKSATKSGYEIATEGDSINLSNINSETRRGRVGKQVAQTLDTSCNQAIIIDDTQGFGDDRYYTEYSPSLRANRIGLKTIDSDFRIRKLTPKETKRLQGFPDSFVSPVSNSQQYKQSGNSISVPVIQAILKNLLVDYLK